MYHSNYLKYFERSREHVLGVEFLKDLYKEGVHFVVAEANLKYRAAANHGDILTIQTTVIYDKSPLIKFKQNALRGDQMIVEGLVHLVTVDGKGRPKCPPESVVKEFTKKL